MLLAIHASAAFAPPASRMTAIPPRTGTPKMANIWSGTEKWAPKWKKDLEEMRVFEPREDLRYSNKWWSPAWKDITKSASAKPTSPAAPAAVTESVAIDLATMSVGQCLNILVDKSLTESVDERIAFLKKNGCRPEVIDSVLKNVNVNTY